LSSLPPAGSMVSPPHSPGGEAPPPSGCTRFINYLSVKGFSLIRHSPLDHVFWSSGSGPFSFRILNRLPPPVVSFLSSTGTLARDPQWGRFPLLCGVAQHPSSFLIHGTDFPPLLNEHPPPSPFPLLLAIFCPRSDKTFSITGSRFLPPPNHLNTWSLFPLEGHRPSFRLGMLARF